MVSEKYQLGFNELLNVQKFTCMAKKVAGMAI